MKKISKKILAGFMVIVLMGGIIGAKNDAYAEEDTQNIETGETQSDEQQTGTTEEDNLDEAEANKENDLKEQEDNVELEQEEEKLIGTDENGEVYEISSESGLVEQEEDIDRMARSSSAKIVNFNTKGAVVTTYNEVETGVQGYTCGAYGADAAYLGTTNGKVKFMLSGIIGEVDQKEVQVVDVSKAESVSYYKVVSGRLYHYIVGNVTHSGYDSCLDNGPAPDYLSTDTNYYSYDGHYFYTYNNFVNMLVDYQNGNRTHSINKTTPYFNYFQYLPLRSQSNYSESELNTFINSKIDSDSKMWNTGSTFVRYQNLYGVNVLMMAGTAALESAWGKSSIAMNKNNLFGLNAVDSSPGESANSYSDVSTCLKDFAETYMSKRWLKPGYGTYKGAFVGNKASGINVHYASDPYWGEKIANMMWFFDKVNGSRDYSKYTIGIKDLMSNEHTVLNIRKESSTSSAVLYQTVQQSQYSFLILNNGQKNNDFYKIQSDAVLTSGRNGIDGNNGVYKFNDMYAYVSSDYISIIQIGNNSSSSGGDSENDNTIPSTWEKAEAITVTEDVKNALSVKTHVKDLGWLKESGNGEQAGTVGISRAMEAIKLQIKGIAGLGIEYSAHVTNDGWQSYVADGKQAGTTGQSKAMQAIKIRLTGEKKNEYQILYRAHVANDGWQDYVTEDEIAGTTGQAKELQAIQIVLLKKEKDIKVDKKDILSYSTYIQDIGWGGNVKNGEQSGTVGLSKAIQSIKISTNLSGLGVEYTTHIPNIGWQSYVSSGKESKANSDPKRIEAIKIRLTGTQAKNYDIYYRVHSKNYGWLGWAKNDEEAGTKGYSCQIEAIQIVVEKKGTSAPGSTKNAFVEKETDVEYSSYVNGEGWKKTVGNGEISGTTGQSKALGGIKVNLNNKGYSGTIQYMSHIQDIGWDDWKNEGIVSGTANGQKRMEAVKIRFTEELAPKYDIYYRVHAQNFGWMGWSKNGDPAGTEGYGYRVEAIQIKIVKKGAQAPGTTNQSFRKKWASIVYSTHVQDIGWQMSVNDGMLAGTTGESKRVEAIKISLSNPSIAGNIEYSTHVQDIGWQTSVKNGKIAGTTGESKRVEAIKIKLSGEIAKQCDVYYRVHVQDYGWLGWAKNNEPAGTEGLSKRVEAIEIRVVTKGESAPETGERSFIKK